MIVIETKSAEEKERCRRDERKEEKKQRKIEKFYTLPLRQEEERAFPANTSIQTQLTTAKH